MSAKLAGLLPKGDADGLAPITNDLIKHPQRFHVLMVLVDCKSVVTDNDSGDVVPTARIRRIEVIGREDRDDLKAAEKLMRRALERRSGDTVLPLDLEDELSIAFAGVDPLTGELYGQDGVPDVSDGPF